MHRATSIVCRRQAAAAAWFDAIDNICAPCLIYPGPHEGIARRGLARERRLRFEGHGVGSGRRARGPSRSRRSTRAAVRPCTARTSCAASTARGRRRPLGGRRLLRGARQRAAREGRARGARSRRTPRRSVTTTPRRLARAARHRLRVRRHARRRAGEPKHAELAARVLHRCVLAVPAGSSLRVRGAGPARDARRHRPRSAAARRRQARRPLPDEGRGIAHDRQADGHGHRRIRRRPRRRARRSRTSSPSICKAALSRAGRSTTRRTS